MAGQVCMAPIGFCSHLAAKSPGFIQEVRDPNRYLGMPVVMGQVLRCSNHFYLQLG